MLPFPSPVAKIRPNAALQARPIAGARDERRLLGVACKRWLGASAAAPPHMWQEQGQPARCVLSSWARPWVVVTVPALVLCARWCGWSREAATTALVTGPVLIPFGRRQGVAVPPAPTALLRLFPVPGGGDDTPQRLCPCPSSTGPYAEASAITRALRSPPGLPPPTPRASTSAKPRPGWRCHQGARPNPCAVLAPAPPPAPPAPPGSLTVA